MRYFVRHHSRVTYAGPIAAAEFNLRLAPIAWPGQTVHRQELLVSPRPVSRREWTGPYLARVTRIAFAAPLSAIDINSSFEVLVDHPLAPTESPMLADIRRAASMSSDLTSASPVPYLFPSQIAVADAGIGSWAAAQVRPGSTIVEAATAICAAIHREFAYRPGVTTSATAPATAFAARAGVCQDFAHVMIVAMRSIGVPAAYVSGYLRTLPPPGGMKLVGADAMHAWMAVWCGPGLGWIGFDPTNNCIARNDHIVVAMGRDYADVSPIDGRFVGNAPQHMQVMVDVSEVAELTG